MSIETVQTEIPAEAYEHVGAPVRPVRVSGGRELPRCGCVDRAVPAGSSCPEPWKHAGYLAKATRGVPSSVTVKWAAVYRELSARLHRGEPVAFEFDKAKGMLVGSFDADRRDDAAWHRFTDPALAAVFLGMVGGAPAVGPVAASDPAPAVACPSCGAPAELGRVCSSCDASVLAGRPLEAPVPAPVAVVELELPGWATDWLGRLLCDAKRAYAQAYVEHIVCGAACPEDPGVAWAVKARGRAEWLAKHHG